MNILDFEGKVAIVTGSSRGIGKETAMQLCERGATVILNGRNSETLELTRHEMSKAGYSVIAIQGDVTSYEFCEKLIQSTISTFGQIDILINNGSVTMNEKIQNLHPLLFQEVFNSNIIGAVFPTIVALPHLTKSKGSVIFISSLGGLHGFPSASAYSMGKMALTAFWQSLKIELSSSCIHFGIIYISFTENEDAKRMITANGTLVKVPNRAKFLQQSRQNVSSSIIYMIKRRKPKMILSPFGKIVAILIRYFPRLTLYSLIRSQKKPI